ncbi:MAG: hypothetical protein ACKVT2_05505 [Saprospiraceae bacterium]
MDGIERWTLGQEGVGALIPGKNTAIRETSQVFLKTYEASSCFNFAPDPQ